MAGTNVTLPFVFEPITLTRRTGGDGHYWNPRPDEDP